MCHNRFPLVREKDELLEFTVGGECFTASGQYLVPVCLMAYIPDYAVVRSIEYVVQGNGQLYRAQAGCEMSGVTRNLLYNVLPQFFTDFRKLFTLSWRKSSGNVMVLSKLYVVGSVLISNLKITKCKNSKRKRMAGSFRRKKKPLLFTSVLLSLCINCISCSACLWLRKKDA